MKNTFIILIFASSLIAGISKFVYDKIDSLKSELLQVKSINSNLRNDNQKLIDEQKKIKKKLKNKRVNFSKKSLIKVTHKFKKAAIGVIPFVGTGAVIALTYDEINFYCNELKEDRIFLRSLYPKDNIVKTNEEKLFVIMIKLLLKKK